MKYSDQMHLPLSLEQTRALCRSALEDLKWNVREEDEDVIKGVVLSERWAFRAQFILTLRESTFGSREDTEVSVALDAPEMRDDLLEVLPRPVAELFSAISATDRLSLWEEYDGERKPTLNQDRLIFISYRREDSPDIVGRIYDSLVQRFGHKAIFKDVDSIPLGVDFKRYLEKQVEQSNVLLAVIGKSWLKKRTGKRRLDNPSDFVRIELASALRREIPVIPLMVSNARMPSESDLPEDLRGLVFRNFIQIRPDPDFHNDMNRLIKELERQP